MGTFHIACSLRVNTGLTMLVYSADLCVRFAWTESSSIAIIGFLATFVFTTFSCHNSVSVAVIMIYAESTLATSSSLG
jgi:hypothetical protein